MIFKFKNESNSSNYLTTWIQAEIKMSPTEILIHIASKPTVIFQTFAKKKRKYIKV